MTDFVELVSKCSPDQSLPPELLQQMHNEAFDAPESPVSHDEWLVWSEFQIKQGNFEKVITAHQYVSDLRCQDTTFRARWYQRHGIPDVSKIGFELSEFHCPIPFRKLDILPEGNCTLCCSAWLRTSSGNLFQGENVWESDNSKSIRDGVQDGTFRHCGKEACYYIRTCLSPHSKNYRLPHRNTTPVPEVTTAPKHLNLSYDFSCNLSCPSCRTSKLMAGEEEQHFLNESTEKYVLPLLRQAEHVEITGSGDPFASRTYYQLLQRLNPDEFPNLKITIMTNGLLLSESVWERIAHIASMIDRINVSVDAASKQTYEQVRRLGDWDRLLKNLDFIGQLRSKNEIGKFRLCFVAQRQNYKEMPDFVTLAENVRADEIHFQQLGDWGVLNPYQNEAIHLTEHPQHEDFMQQIQRLPKSATVEILHEFS